MSIDWEECDPESGVITQVLGRSYRDHNETGTYVRRESREHMERFVYEGCPILPGIHRGAGDERLPSEATDRGFTTLL